MYQVRSLKSLCFLVPEDCLHGSKQSRLVPIATAADNKFCNIFPNFQKNKV